MHWYVSLLVRKWCKYIIESKVRHSEKLLNQTPTCLSNLGHEMGLIGLWDDILPKSNAFPAGQDSTVFSHLLNPNWFIQTSLGRTVLFIDFISMRHRNWEFRTPFISPKLLDPLYRGWSRSKENPSAGWLHFDHFLWQQNLSLTSPDPQTAFDPLPCNSSCRFPTFFFTP